jgi:hypothetical protein
MRAFRTKQDAETDRLIKESKSLTEKELKKVRRQLNVVLPYDVAIELQKYWKDVKKKINGAKSDREKRQLRQQMKWKKRHLVADAIREYLSRHKPE